MPWKQECATSGSSGASPGLEVCCRDDQMCQSCVRSPARCTGSWCGSCLGFVCWNAQRAESTKGNRRKSTKKSKALGKTALRHQLTVFAQNVIRRAGCLGQTCCRQIALKQLIESMSLNASGNEDKLSQGHTQNAHDPTQSTCLPLQALWLITLRLLPRASQGRVSLRCV